MFDIGFDNFFHNTSVQHKALCCLKMNSNSMASPSNYLDL